jgi:hypothetical protein
VAVAGGIAYLANGGVQLVDVCQAPSSGAAAVVAEVETGGNAEAVAVSGGRAYVGGNAGLAVVDVSDPANPAVLGSASAPGNALGVAVAGGVAYVADAGEDVQAVDITDPAAPAIIGSFKTAGSAGSLALAGNVVYVADGSALRILPAVVQAVP